MIKMITLINQLINQVGSGIYYYSVPFSSITSGWTPPAVISHLTDCLDDWSGLWLSPRSPTPALHTSAAAHTSWAVSNSKPGQYRAWVNVAISARIGPIPHNLVCTWHLALNHKSVRLQQVFNLSTKQLYCPSTVEEGKSTFNYLSAHKRLHCYRRTDVMEAP